MKLLEYFESNQDRNAMTKWLHYFEIYEKHFNKFIGKNVKILEIGVWQGGSLKMWKEYFGKNAQIIGVDINSKCKQIEDEQIKIYIGDQANIEFLNKLIDEEKNFDIIIDDGGHLMNQQITSFKTLYPFVNNGGIYLCEDLHTNYWTHYGGGYKSKNTFIELTKNLIDELHAFFSQSDDLVITDFTKSTTGIHIYDSVVVFDKQYRNKPEQEKIGKEIW
jgi:23S rRNA U2552 (ribose-2'-O)-methylase RlmE/FtsJ